MRPKVINHFPDGTIIEGDLPENFEPNIPDKVVDRISQILTDCILKQVEEKSKIEIPIDYFD